jgi:putative ABC transport system permease protein
MTWRPPTLWKYTLREAHRRPGRALLTLAGVVIGVASVVAVQAGGGATHDAYHRMFRAVAGRADLEVVRPGQGPFDAAPVLAALDGAPGVRAALPVVQVPSALLTPDGPVPLYLLAVDPQRDDAARDYPLQEGSGLDGGGLLLEARFAARHGLRVGDTATLQTPTGPAPFVVAGLLRPGGVAAFNGGAVAFLPLNRARPAFAPDGQVNAVQLVLDRGADRDAVAAAAQERVGAGLTVRPTDERAALGRAGLAAIDLELSTLGVAALVAGAFVVLNAFHMSLGERRRQLALLRALGATRRQVTRLLLREAVLVGLLGSALGLPLGWGLAAALVRVNERVLGIALPPPRLTPVTLALGAALGPLMSVVATLTTSRRAAARPPLAELATRHVAAAEPTRRGPVLAGLALVAVALLLLATVPAGLVARERGAAVLVPVMVLALAGSVLALPLALRPLLAAAAWLADRRPRPEGRLALRQLRRQPTRTALTAGALFVGVVVSVAYGLSFRNNVADIRVWYDRTVAAPFYVRPATPDSSTTVTLGPLPAGTAEAVAGLDATGRVGRLAFLDAHVNGEAALLIAREPGPGGMALALVQGDEAALPRRLMRGEIVLGTALALRLGVGPDDKVTLDTPHGPRALTVAAVVKEYSVGGRCAYLAWEAADGLFGGVAPQSLEVSAKPGREAELEGELRRLCRDRGLTLQTNADFRASVQRAIDNVEATTWALVGLVFVVSALGIVNTLTTNVLEQTRELGVLRALGLKRSQVRRLIVWQALALALASALPGLAVGVLLALLMNWTTPAFVGLVVPFRVDWPFAGLCVAGAALLATLAALLPARRAAGLQVVEALRYE